MSDFKHHFIHVNGIKLHYVTAGKGPKLLLLLHGWPEFWYCWRHQLAALSSEFTVVAPDLRGFNLSDKPKNLMSYTQAEVAKDVVALIKGLGYKKAFLGGHDWGGAISWSVAINYPEVVEKLIILNCPHPANFIKQLQSKPLQIFKSWYIFFFQIPVLPEWLLNSILPKLFKTVFRGWAYNKERFSDDVIDKYVEAYRQAGAMTGGLNYYRANLRVKPKESNGSGRKVQAPALMIWGTGDKVLNESLTIGTSHYIDNSFTLKKIPNGSHWIQNDFPEEVNQYMLEFLTSNIEPSKQGD